ncbi:MAG: aspartate-semialdehyde dehydrogenase [Clostridiales bacterium]|jgi:aspartate-semialdehyde dehydrogenase|nr:aspartate-semialdehyde dehydrogenase [Clostridiales bacterium]
MKKFNVGIMGATGAVGQEMIKVLGERNFPIGELRCLASERSEGKVLSTPFGDVTVQRTCETAFDGLDIVLGASENDIAEAMAPHIKAAGAVFVDNSSAFRLDTEVPLVVPEINPGDVLEHNGIISNPNCTTIISLVAVNAINKLSEIEAIYASSYQATSGAGAAGPREMYDQSEAVLKARAAGGKGNSYGADIDPKVFQYQIAYNVIPQIGGFGDNLYSSEEMKLQNEGRKILHQPELRVSCTCVRVPVERSHAVSIDVITKDKLDLDDVRKAVSEAPGAKLYDEPHDKIYPMPLLTSNQDIVYVGRIRRDLVNDNGINLWCCGDQVRKGAATNAVQIAELLTR